MPASLLSDSFICSLAVDIVFYHCSSLRSFVLTSLHCH